MASGELLADRACACRQQVAAVSEKEMSGGLAVMTGGT
jgi:hypothetical protein